MVLGNKYLLILDVESIAGSGARRVSLVNFDTWTEVPILTVNASSSVPLPIVNPSQSNGAVFLVFGQDGTQHTNVAIRRSNNGDVLCSLGAPIIPTGQTLGEATATELIIHYSTGSTSKQNICPLPIGECKITPSSQTFSDVAVGGCPVTTLPTKQFTIENIGNDCLTVNSIANNPPFSVQATSHPIPATLAKTETLDVTVVFNPTALGNWNSVELAVSTTPANGDNKLVCTGNGIAAQPKVQFNQTTFNFGTHPVGTPAPSKTLTITNNGTSPLTVSVPVLNTSGFTCAGFNGTLNCDQSQTIALGFTAPSEGPQSATLNITTNAAGSPHSIQLMGVGCIANAEIVVPPTTPIQFGQIEQGFRTVRFFEVHNIGDGQLTFDASISGPDAALFGLPDPQGSVTNAPMNRSYTVDPVNFCGSGPTGTGGTIVAISFFANDTPRVVSAMLTLSGHNASNFPATQTWTFPISGEVTPPIALDVGLVVDRSGSMNDLLGSRVKMDAAIAASQLFVELLRPDMDDRVAVIRFNHNPEVVIPMSPVSTTAAQTQNDILQKVRNDIPPATGATAIAGGAMTAFKEIQSPRTATPPQLRKTVVVLSDGIENTGFENPAGSGQWYSILGGSMLNIANTSPITIPSDIDVYTVGLGRSSDISPAQLNGLASPGNFFHVDQDLWGHNYFQLEKYYTQIFMDIVGTSSVIDPMYWIPPGQVHEIEFDVLRGDVNALIVLYDWEGMRLPFYCLSPRGEIIDPAVIPQGYQIRAGATNKARFIEFKMPMKEPDRYAGRWKVIVEHPKHVCMGMPHHKGDKTHYKDENIGFLPPDCKEYPQPIQYGVAIGVGSNFRMRPFVTPGAVYIGEPILLTVLISEAGLPVTGCNVIVEAISPNGATWTLQLLDDGTHSDGDSDDGEYAHIFTHTYMAGTYHFHFKAVGKSRDGEPVVREAVRDKAVLRRISEETMDRDKPDASEECCKELLKEIHTQTRLLERALKPKKAD